jgi:hypothetical protein
MPRFSRTVAAGALGSAMVIFGPIGQASSSSGATDLAVSGFVAGGEQNVATFHPVVFVFTLADKGPRPITSADQSYTSVQNGSITDQLCVFPNGTTFNPDSPACEYGGIKVNQSAQMTLIVQPDPAASGQHVSVRVCASNESDVPDPVARNNCLSLSVALQ